MSPLRAVALVLLLCAPRARAGEPPAALEVPADAPSRGPAAAPVTLVEFADFECRPCRRSRHVVDHLVRRYGPLLRVVYRHQPLSMHAGALRLAEASMAAHAQGRFWALHDAIYAEPPGTVDGPRLEALAERVGLDVPKLRAALAAGTYRARVQQDLAAAEALQVEATPTFFINGRRLLGAKPTEIFTRLVDEALRAQGLTPPDADADAGPPAGR